MYHSSNGVDALIEPLLPDVGWACEVGANDGQYFSNCLHFEEIKGWTVLCVEPNPLLLDAGKSVRALWRQVAAAGEDGPIEFHSWGGFPYPSGSGTSIKSRTGTSDRQVFTVQGLRLDRILEEAGFHKLDLLTVDVEGFELEVMRGFSIERWKPKIIVLEFYPDDFDYNIPGYTKIDRKEFDNVYQRNGA